MTRLLRAIDTAGQAFGLLCLGPVLIVGLLSPVLVPVGVLVFGVVGGWR